VGCSPISLRPPTSLRLGDRDRTSGSGLDRRGSLPHNKPDREVDAGAGWARAAGEAEHEPGGLVGHLDQWLSDSRQGGADPLGDGQVVVPDDGEVLVDAKPHLAGGPVQAERL